MKKGARTGLLLALLFCVTGAARAADNGSDSHDPGLLLDDGVFRNPTLTGYFNEVILSAQRGMVDGTPCYLFGDMWLSFGLDNKPMEFNMFGGFMIPVFKHLVVPVFGEFVINGSNFLNLEGADHRFYYTGIAGSGLAIYGRFGVLGAYLGYGGGGDELREWKFDPDWSLGDGYHYQTAYEIYWENLYWGIYPIINAKEVPLLNTFIQTIDGFFNLDRLHMDRDEFQPSYKANVIFRNIGGLSLSTYTRKDWFNSEAKCDVYAGKIEVRNPDDPSGWSFGIEGGYRTYFDVTLNRELYEDGVYGKISLNLESIFSIFCESGSLSFFKNPTVGIFFHIMAEDKSRFNMLYAINDFEGGGMDMGFSGRLH